MILKNGEQVRFDYSWNESGITSYRMVHIPTNTVVSATGEEIKELKGSYFRLNKLLWKKLEDKLASKA